MQAFINDLLSVEGTQENALERRISSLCLTNKEECSILTRETEERRKEILFRENRLVLEQIHSAVHEAESQEELEKIVSSLIIQHSISKRVSISFLKMIFEMEFFKKRTEECNGNGL
ncbi:hypothetical protein NEFER03_1387 [Nematocida sp. LUAm3]|nr:hypothetical protein NEFER03_1387 [Nematocida sp. LUAm3]KAI5174783.1 hypothetical protein NEFER02_0893 [Nematocida sp. LUAm2]KAI5177806.1 hypothetical protein NEFER01_1008 [Nematocida sp. LUAm1]